MSRQIKHFYDFGEFRIDVAGRVLLRNGEILPLTQKAFEVLLFLVERGGDVVEKDELMQRVWQDSFVEESNLAQNIYTLRKILGKTEDGLEYIVTFPRRGYRFAVSVRESREENERAIAPESTPFAKEALELEDFGFTQDEEQETVELRVIIKDEKQEKKSESSPKTEIALDSAKSNTSGFITKSQTALVISLVLVVVVAAGIALWLYKGRSGINTISADAFRQISITNLTTTGNLTSAAVSPDGKSVVYGVADKPQLHSLHVVQLATLTDQTVIPPSDVYYYSLTFSRDGNYIYYVAGGKNINGRALFRVSSFGGPSTKLIENVDTAVSFSPDGERFVFRRSFSERKEAALFVANADGTGEKEVAAIRFPEIFQDPAWSPDGKMIACAVGQTTGGKNMYVASMQVGEWKIKPVSEQRWRWIGQMAWLADSAGLLMVASEDPSTPYQVWRLSYPKGEATKITNDSNNYNRLSLSADSRTLVTTQRQQATSVWIVPEDDASGARQITRSVGGYRGKLSWTPDNKIVYDSSIGNPTAISIMNADGSNQKQLTGDRTGRAVVGYSAVSTDGRYIVFYSDITGTRHVWRMNIDGSNPVQLTNGNGEDHPHISPDSRWVVFTRRVSKDSERPTLWKVSIDGGEPVQLTKSITAYPAVSPDGKSVACFYAAKESDSWRIAIFPFEGGEPVKIFPTYINASPNVRWTPDGRGLTYADNTAGASKIIIQPLDGSEPEQLIEFNDEIFGFDWSRDGKQLACVRGVWAANAVLIKDVK